MSSLKIFIILASLIGRPSLSYGDIPSWAKKDSTRRQGSLLTTVCEGTGPSASLARKEAISGCQVTAKQFLNRETKIKTLSVETEYSVGFHQEVEETGIIHNLTCNPKRDEVTERADQYHVWVECQFDLNQTKSEPARLTKPIVEKEEGIKSLKAIKPSTAVDIDRDIRTVFLESIPSCESIVVRGQKPRTLKCETNPMRVVVDKSDEEIIVRATGFLPKTISIQKGRSNETLQVFLERN